MLKNYLTIALRTLKKQKLYAVVNVFGLAVGLACFLLILLYVQHELSYDRFHANADRIYRVVQQQPGNIFLGSDHFGVMPAPLARTLTEEYAEVEQATAIDDYSTLISRDDAHFQERGLWADAHVFDVFTFPMIRGNPVTALAEPNSLVLTESLAEKIFGDDDPMGQTLLLGNEDAYTVTGMIRDVPENTHFTFDFIAPIQSNSNYARNLEENNWNNSSWSTYFVLAEGADVDRLEAQMPALVQKYVVEGDDPDEEPNRYYFEALTNIHLRSQINFGLGGAGDIKYVYLFGAIGLAILLLACVNYTNLAVARSIKRAREVGMRKAVGAQRGQLIRQFLGESVLMTVMALVLALALAHALLPVFGYLVERSLHLDYVGNPWLLPGLLVLIVLVGLLAGSYPALFMSSLRPIQVLKGTNDHRAPKSRLRRLLIVGQFAASIALVTASLIIYQQLQYVQTKDVGYDREHVVTVRMRGDAMRENYATIRAELLRHPNVVAVTATGHLPTNIGSQTTIQDWDGNTEDDRLPIYQSNVDYDYLEVFGIELAAGRTFSRAMASDTLGAYLINETAARAMGWTPEEAVGKHFKRSEDEKTIIGVVKDFHMHSLHQPIQPLMIYRDTEWLGYVAAKARPEGLPETIAHIEQTVEPFSSYPFDYQFLDETFDQLYKADMRLGETFGFFTVLALLIASLGLFGLAAFAAEQRTKEIGVRKVLGATMPHLVLLLSKEFTQLVLVAAVLAVPVAYVGMNRWLEDFAYRIDIGVGVFAVAFGASLLIAWLSVSYQALKAARVNPVESLRYE